MLEIIFVLAAFALGFAFGRMPNETLAHLKELSGRAINALRFWGS